MGKIGLINKIARNLENSWMAYNLVSKSPQVKSRNAILDETLSLLKDVKSVQDIMLSLGVEEMLLHQELSLYANSHEEINSIKNGIVQIQEAKKSFVIVQDSKAYQNATDTYSIKTKELGLPIDSFHQFLKSHRTRLANRMTSNLPVAEKNILRQRQENLSMVKELYIAMQREALGLPAPGKSQGLSR